MLITTKIETPSLRSRMLFRKNLIQRLNVGRSYPFIQISGPAGSGKTSLTCQWIGDARLKVAWYSMDQEDNEPDLFYRYLLSAFIHADDQLNGVLGPMLGNKHRLSGSLVIPHIIDSLSGSPQKIHLILDDLHNIENEEILDAIARLMQYIPANLQVVILTRYGLPGSVDAVALKKEHLRISASDLKFTEAETAALFHKIIHTPLPVDLIRELNQHVEGWAAGLQLIGLEVQSKGNHFDFSGILNQAHDQVASYLIHDILSMQSEEIRNFVFATALLDRFDHELCAEITGQVDAVKIITRLARMNLFLIPLDKRRKWYRYHHMFSEVVRRRIAVHNPDLISTTLRKAALWFAEKNHMEDAMRSAIRSNDYEFAADLMEDHINQYLQNFDHTAGLRWILRLPKETLDRRALLRLHQCNFLMILTELSKMEDILATIESLGNSAFARYSDEKRILCEDYTIYLKCMLQILQAAPYVSNDQFQHLAKKISPKNKYFLLGLEMTFGFTLISKGDFKSAEETLLENEGRKISYETIGGKIISAKAKSLIARYRGRLHQAEAIILLVLQEVDQQGLGNTSMAFSLHRHMGHIYYLQNRLEEARKYASLAVRYCAHSGMVEEIMAGSELWLLLHLAAGDMTQATESIKQMRAFAVKLGNEQVTACADACDARIAVEQGNLAVPILWSRRRNLQVNEPFSLLFAMECLTQARIFYAQEKYTKAAHLLEDLKNRCLKRSLLELVLQIDILRCAVFNAMDQQEKAEAILKDALAFSETEGYIRPFTNNSALIVSILKRIENVMPSAALTVHLKKVFTSCNTADFRETVPSNSGIVVHEKLTEREIEILEWMAKGSQNKEIAQKTFISINTVKTHVRRILAKLSVSTRTQAIIKAKEIDILKNS